MCKVLKTGIITDEVSQDLAVAIALAKAFHLDALEIRSVEEKNPFQMSRGDYQRIAQQAAEAGLAVCCVGSPFFKCDIEDEAAVAEHMEGLRRTIEGTHILGAKMIRGFSFWRSKTVTPERIADRYAPVIELAQREDVTLVLESEPSVNTGNMQQLATLLAVIRHARIRALYDPGNEICDHGAPAPYPAGYQCLRPYLAHVHVKDMVRTKDGFDPACIGKGQVDFDSIFDALRKDGYDGYATLETHWRVLERMDEALMTRPQGSSFSMGGEEASRICLQVLRDQYGFGA